MEELTTEQLEIQERQQQIEGLKHGARLGKLLEKMKKTPEYKELIEGVFLNTGKDILWQNIRALTEGQMQGRGSDKNLELIEKIKGQVQSRIDFEGFLDTVEHDAINATAELEEMDKE